MAAPQRLIPDSVIREVLAWVATGQPLDTACRNAGIARNTFYVYMRADQQLVQAYADAVREQTRARYQRS